MVWKVVVCGKEMVVWEGDGSGGGGKDGVEEGEGGGGVWKMWSKG